MSRKSIISLITLLLLGFPQVDLLAQSDYPFREKRERKNIISLQASISEHFDRTPIVNDLMAIQFGGKRVFPQGIDYFRYLGAKGSVLFSIARFRYGYLGEESYPNRAGDITFRNGLYLDAAYGRSFWDRKYFDVSGMIGLSYRYGTEEVWGYYLHYQQRETYVYGLSDLGAHTGIRANFALPWNLRASAMMKYTLYLYRHDSHVSWDVEFANRSTRSRLTFQVGLGYSF